MQVQKGLVKYKDRSDILCTYGITDDGKTYYFLEGNTIPNGNIVATTVLVEAIDPLVVSSSIGVIDPEGNVVIPFENKAVKPLSNDLLLVEKATPVTDSVIEAVELLSDPSAASRLVSTPAAIKENMHIKMGDAGRFVFNDQFSEATICDVNGNNLVNDELFSFIGLTDDRMFLSKNVEIYRIETKGKQKKVYTTDKTTRNYPVVVLVDEGSASASEILASAFHDKYKKATIVGVTTYGKGSIQKAVELPGGSSLKYTTQRWLTSKGKSLQDKGLTPDVVVEQSKEYYENQTEENDAQLQKALEILNKKES